MKAIILAGGAGTRLRPLTEKMPKPLIPVAGRPCIDFVVKSLVASDFREIVITTGYMSGYLMKKMGNGLKYDASILYSFEETPAGTAGAVKIVEDFIDDTFVVASGDVLADVDMADLYDYHRRTGSVATMALTEVENPEGFGIVELDDRNRITRFKEKPKANEVFSNLINAGIYILEPEVLDFIPRDEMFDFSKNVFPALLKEEMVICGRKLEGLWMDIGKPDDLMKASMEVIMRQGEEFSTEGIESDSRCIISDSANLETGVRLVGPCFIGDDALVGRDSVIENSCVYENVLVERDSVIKNSIVLEKSKIGLQSEILDSILSANCAVEEDVRIMRSIIGDDMTIKTHSRLENANVSPPADEES
ncbi:MAG: NDP-sugar synthase [Methanobacteriota archaeon]|nr:MAG: NDP-sugar synthase [Euryarchaeota archaeon]